MLIALKVITQMSGPAIHLRDGELDLTAAPAAAELLDQLTARSA